MSYNEDEFFSNDIDFDSFSDETFGNDNIENIYEYINMMDDEENDTGFIDGFDSDDQHFGISAEESDIFENQDEPFESVNDENSEENSDPVIVKKPENFNEPEISEESEEISEEPNKNIVSVNPEKSEYPFDVDTKTFVSETERKSASGNKSFAERIHDKYSEDPEDESEAQAIIEDQARYQSFVDVDNGKSGKKKESKNFFSKFTFKLNKKKSRGAASSVAGCFNIKEEVSPENKEKIEKQLVRSFNFFSVCAAFSAALTLLLLLVGGVPQFLASFFNIELALKMFGGKGQLYLIFNLVLISLVCLVGLPVIINGIKSLFSGGFCSDTGVMFALVLALVQNLLFVFSNNLVQENIKLLGCVAAFMLTCHMGARVIYIRQLIGEFEFCSQEMSFCNISEISNSADSTRIFKDVLSGEPDVKYSERVKSFSEFFETSSVSLPGDKTMKRLLPPTLLASLVIGMLVFIVSGDFLTGFTSLTAMVCVSVPAAVTIVDMLPFSVINDTLKPINAVIHSCAAAEEYAKTNAVVFDAEDIFENGGSLTGGVQFNQTSKVDSGILCAAALAKAVNSPLADEFMKMIVNGHGVLPPVRNVHVEDGLGIVGLVNGKLILLGNDELMKKYNVKQLPKKDVSKFNHDGCRPLYIAEQDTILTTFGEVYRANGRAKSCMLRMMNNNIMMYICSDDPGISEAFVEEVFLLAPNSVEIIRGESAKIYQEKYKNIIKENIRPGIIHTNRINSFLNSVDACLLLKEIFDVSRVIEQVGVGIGFALFAVLCLMVPIFAGASQIFVYQLLFTLLVYFLSKGYKSKKKGRR